MASIMRGVKLPSKARTSMITIVKAIKDGLENDKIQNNPTALSLKGQTHRYSVGPLEHCMKQIASVTPEGERILQLYTRLRKADLSKRGF